MIDNNQLLMAGSNKHTRVRTLPKNIFLEKLLEYRTKELLEFQDKIIKKMNEVLNKLNLGKLSI
ncbi:MAG: hypothetical protein WC516_05570 [Patescibacteria group bacterium]